MAALVPQVLKVSDDELRTQALILKIVLEGLKDKIVQVNKQAMKVLETYVAEYSGDLDPVGSDFNQILKYLLNMMSDNRLANGCSDLYLMILHHEGSNFNSLASFTFKPSSFF